jgi:hypothetical protein
MILAVDLYITGNSGAISLWLIAKRQKYMAPSPLSRHEVDVAALARINFVTEVAKTVRTALVFGCILGIAYFCQRTVHDLAGKTTAADIGLKFLGTLKISEGLAWATAAICLGTAVKTRRTNGNMAARLARLADFERSIDPNRSSSHLSPTGMPRKEDR